MLLKFRITDTAFRPSELVSILSSCLINKEQQDAQELFQLISTALDNENQLVHKQQGNSKVLENPFTGLLANRLSCMQCGYTEAIRHFPFNNVQLTLPSHDTTTLDDCLQQLTTMEFLNDVACQRCTLLEAIRRTNSQLEQIPTDPTLLKTKQDLEYRLAKGQIEQETGYTLKGLSSKHAMFAKPPKVLCLHIARSALNLTTGEVYKNTCRVKFPEILDLSPYCTNEILNTTDPHLPISLPSNTTQTIRYRLMSTIVHYGSHNYGHFIAYKRRLVADKCHCTGCSDDQTVLRHHASDWFKISDDHVQPCKVESVLTANPYMLLYEMVDEEETEPIKENWTQPVAPPSSPLLTPFQKKTSCSFYKPLSNPQRRAMDLSKISGHKYIPEFVSCNRRDYIMYALSVGVAEDELEWLYELDKNFGPLPAYPICLILKGDGGDVNSFIERFTSGGSLPGLPPLDYNKMVHGEQSFEVIRPFPANGGRFKYCD
ncbi:hypothetical protein G6F56_008470 [Rhizopus delemar]|nr:hypothetical protein G6F56_008470 [Rhizopus delemar]